MMLYRNGGGGGRFGVGGVVRATVREVPRFREIPAEWSLMIECV